MKSFLLIGQSNMAGRGDFGEVPEIINPNCFMLRNGKWVPMSEPINPDRSIFNYFHSIAEFVPQKDLPFRAWKQSPSTGPYV